MGANGHCVADVYGAINWNAEDEANFIITAVNQHAALARKAAALDQCVKALERAKERLRGTGSIRTTILIDEALTAAREAQSPTTFRNDLAGNGDGWTDNKTSRPQPKPEST